MATKKKLLQAAAGTAAASGGAGGLNVESLFSTYLYEGNGSSQTIQNGVNLGQSYGSGSARFGGTATGEYLQTPVSTDFVLGSGDFTIEFWMNVTSSSGNNQEPLSFGDGTGDYDPVFYLSGTTLQFYGSTSGTAWDLLSGVSVGTITYGTWHHVAVTRNVDGVRCYLDGVQGSGTGIGSSSFSQTSNQVTIGRGQDTKRFYGYLSDVHFVKGTALYTGSSYTLPTSATTAHANTKLLTLQQDDLLTDNSTTGHTITEYGGSIYDEPVFGPFDADEAGEGGLVWIKNRETTDWHALFDTERGVGIQLASNDTRANYTLSNALTSFNSTGFSLGNDNSAVNSNAEDFASWTFRKAPKFFDVQTFTSASSGNTTFNHDLGATPAFVIIKNTQTSDPWVIYHVETGNDKYLSFDTSAAGTLSGSFSVDSTSVTVSSMLMYTSQSYVAYLFAHNDGDGEFGPDGDADIIKCGSYSGTGASGNFVDLGFEPQWLLLKNATDPEAWWLFDNMRGAVSGGNDARLIPNLNNAESSYDNITFHATGFTPSTNNYVNGQSDNMIYIAIRRGPMAVPTDATDVFFMDVDGNAGDPAFRTTDAVDFSMIRRPTTTDPFRASSRLTGSIFLDTNTTAAEDATNTNYVYDYNNGFGGWTTLNSGYQAWMWKRAPNYFDVVAFELGNNANREVKHNLNATPEMIWWKKRSGTSNWAVFHKDLGQSKYLLLQDTAAEATSSNIWGTSSFSSTAFYLNETSFGVSGDDCIAYLFASVDGVSKVGSYTGTGAAQNIDCGFSSGARFVLIKRTDDTSPWWLWDSERGIVSGTEPFLDLNSNAQQTTMFDWLDPNSSGFSIPSGGNNNVSGASYIFYAIA